jgi:hypothetical protein
VPEAVAQNTEPAVPDTTVAEPSLPSRPLLAPTISYLRVGVEGIFDSNIEREPEELEGFGVAAGLDFQVQSSERLPLVLLGYSGDFLRYNQVTRWNRWVHRFGGELQIGMGRRARVGLEARMTIGSATEDHELADVATLSPQIDFELAKWLDVRLYSAMRTRRYDIDGRDQTLRYVGVDNWIEMNRRFTIWIGYRYGENEADDPTDDYVQSRFGTGFEVSPGRNDVFQIEVEFRPRRYRSDLVELETGWVLRRDEKWVAQLRWDHRMTRWQTTRVQVDARRRDSTDPDKPYEDLRLSFGLRWRVIR